MIEIVTEPDMRSAEEAAAFVRQLQAILRHIGASDANMDRVSFRVPLKAKREAERACML